MLIYKEHNHLHYSTAVYKFYLHTLFRLAFTNSCFTVTISLWTNSSISVQAPQKSTHRRCHQLCLCKNVSICQICLMKLNIFGYISKTINFIGPIWHKCQLSCFDKPSDSNFLHFSWHLGSWWFLQAWCTLNWQKVENAINLWISLT